MFWELLPSSITEKIESPYRYDARLTVKKLLKSDNRKRVLDAGAGDCFAKNWFKNHDYIGIDIEKSGTAIQGNIEKLNFQDNFFDFVLCLEVLEHIANPLSALSEIRRVLKNGGVAVVSTPLLSAGYHNDFFRWSPLGLREIFKIASLEVLSISPVGGYCRMLGLQISKISYFIKKPTPFP